MSNLSNGDLLNFAEINFDLLITTDKNLRYQQNLVGRQLRILVLPTTNWPRLRSQADDVAAAVNSMNPGEYRELVLSP